jgi:cytochrome c peroxidase
VFFARTASHSNRKDFYFMRQKHVLGALLLLCAGVILPLALAQSTSSTLTLPAWLTGALQQAQSAPLLPTILLGKVPATLPQTTTTVDVNGQTTTYFPGGPITTSNRAFFQSLGTNGRTCFSCHQPQNNWSTTPATLLTTYVTTLGKDPVFAPIDGSDCPTTGAAASTFGLKFIQARVQLFTKGNFRIFLTAPANPQWYSVSVSSDPTGCELSPTYGLPSGGLSFYRRPLPATNVIYTSPGSRKNPDGTPVPNIMWDTREPSLANQFMDATLTHAQAAQPPTAAQMADGVAFQSGSFTAQTSNFVAGDLTGADGGGATGGPVPMYNYSLATLPPPPGTRGFGVGCAIAASPCPGSTIANPPGDPGFQELGAYATYNGGTTAAAEAMRASISRGEVIFNTRSFTVNGVTGLNDIGRTIAASQVASCSTCHNNANVGNDTFNDPKHIGVGDNSYVASAQTSANGSTTLPMTPDQPVFTFLCPVGSINYFSNPVVGPDGNTYDEYQTSDPGVGWITGSCNDLGKFKVSSLRGIGGRPPFFHGGEAATMTDVVVFYNNRFNIGLSTQDIIDLTNFMNAQ